MGATDCSLSLFPLNASKRLSSGPRHGKEVF
jgi:hypothetical protein